MNNSYNISKSREYREDHYKKYPWKRHYTSARSRCIYKYSRYYNNRGIKFNLTVDDTKMLWFRDQAYLLKRPSLDRRDNAKGYTKENCQFIKLSINVCKDHKGKPLSEKHKQKIGLANFGHRHKEDTKRRMSIVKKGKLFSKEHKQKMSLSQKRRRKLEKELGVKS